MASGREHDKATKVWALPIGIVVTLLMGIENGLISTTSFLIGGLWFSPDLDTHSRSLNRWGILQAIWWPYRKLITHRSILSHGVFIGTGIRLLYLLLIINIIVFLFMPLGNTNPIESTNVFLKLLKEHPQKTLSVLIGLEASVWLHLLKDGDPYPRELRKRRKK